MFDPSENDDEKSPGSLTCGTQLEQIAGVDLPSNPRANGDIPCASELTVSPITRRIPSRLPNMLQAYLSGQVNLSQSYREIIGKSSEIVPQGAPFSSAWFPSPRSIRNIC